MFLTERRSRFGVGKNLSDLYSKRNDLKSGDALSPFDFKYVVEYKLRRIQVSVVDL